MTAACVVLIVASTGLAVAQTVTLDAVRDNTLYETADGSLSNGEGEYGFTGRTNRGDLRRMVVAFDPAAEIPGGATVTSVELALEMSKTIVGPVTVRLHRLTADWGEAGSVASVQGGGQGAPAENGDATWIHSFFPNAQWGAEGGDFVAAASASVEVDAPATYTWSSTPELVADVQGWLDDPSTSHGWIVIADESGSSPTAKRFNTREHPDSGTRPRLVVEYTMPGQAPTASFEVAPQMPVAGEQVSFTDTSSGDPDSWMWEFGDGASSSDQNPAHTYSAPGTYTVSLTATNASGSDTATAELEVLPGSPAMDHETVIPAAASVGGAAGSFFRTLVEVNNAGDAPLAFELLWLPRDSDNADPSVTSGVMMLAPGETRRFPDVVGQTLGLSDAAGAILITASTPDLISTSRTFNVSDTGTFGQSLPGIPVDELFGADRRVRVLLMTENTDFRSNLGVVNGTDRPVTVRFERFDAQGTSLGTGRVDLAAYDNTQRNRLFRDVAPIEGGYVDVWTDDADGLFTCYGSVLDNATSDPTTVLPE